jgi:hypothetical protein
MKAKSLHWDQEVVLEELEPAVGFAVVEVGVERFGEGTPPLVAPS